jgi:diguanylate cyclase (GGDEF)-like protein/PAS domain S-box-containing protein
VKGTFLEVTVMNDSIPDLQDPEMLRSILESLQTGLYLVDRDRRILLWNDGAERISGYLRQDVIGRYCRDNILVHCDESNRILCGFECPLNDTMHDGEPRVAEIYLLHREGHRVPVRVRAVPIRDRHGSIIGAAETFEERYLLPDPERRDNCFATAPCMDEMSGLPDHALVESLLRENINLFAEHAIPFALLCVQIDQLDHFTATHGREAGNAILSAVARTLKNTLRPCDPVGRWAEDRFLAIVPYCAGSTVEQVGERLKNVVGFAAIPWWGDRVSITISVGATSVCAGDDAGSIVSRAEKALEQSLASGGDCVSGIYE